MFLNEFHTCSDGITYTVTPQQASRFAKEVAGDYNPIHDPDAKRFCVPGDLLFALVLTHYGLSERMSFSFKDMVGEAVKLRFPEDAGEAFNITDANGKVYLHIQRSGAVTRDPRIIEMFIRRYVAFSGQNFPHVLQPLMAEQKVMFNPARPLVIYDSMGFQLERLDALEQQMAMSDAAMDVTGKRGEVRLTFALSAGGEAVGSGTKKLLIGGLREYDEDLMQEVIDEFHRRKASFRYEEAAEAV